jgi:AcrR family transcriptional regulator
MSARTSSAKPGPGRPTAARIEAINRAILVAARKEFKAAGYEGARMEAIAAAAGVSKGTLYGRYPTKEALLQAVVAERVATWAKDIEPDGGPVPTDLRSRLKHRARRIMEYNCSGKLDLLERLFTGGPAMHELRRMRHAVGHERTLQVIADDILQGTRDRPITSQAAHLLAEMLVALLYGWWRAHQEVRPVSLAEGLAYADHAVDVLLDGRAVWPTLAAAQ